VEHGAEPEDGGRRRGARAVADRAGARTPDDVAATQRQLKLVQWLNPLAAGAIIVAGSWQSEQQRPPRSRAVS
jgi:hypothetical protein